MRSSSHRRTELSGLCLEHARTCVPNSFSFSQLHPVRAGILLGEKSNSGSLPLVTGKALKLTELFAASVKHLEIHVSYC